MSGGIWVDERLFEHGSDGVVVLDSVGKITFANSSARERLGRKSKILPSITAWPAPASEVVVAIREAWQQALATGKTTCLDVKATNGSTLQLKAIPGDGRVSISLKTTSSEEVERDENQFRALAESLPHFVWRTDAEGILNYGSAKLFTYIGIQPEAVKNLGWLDSISLEDAKTLKMAWRRARETRGPIDILIRVTRASDGQRRWMHILGSPTTDAAGEFTGWIGSWTDVHELMEQRQALEQSNRELELAQHLSGIGSWTCSAKSDDMRWSMEMYRLFDFDPSAPAPSLEEMLERIPADEHERIVPALQDAIHLGKPFRVEHRIMLPDRTIRHVLSIAEFHADIGCVLGAVIDMTEQAQSERQLRASNASLESISYLLQHQATVLAETNADLEELAARDTLTQIANRRIFEQRLELETRWAHNQGTPLVLVMVDVDHFKSFNDEFGHVSGDAVLEQVAKIITRAVAKRGLPARYGGEEFVVILPGVTAQIAWEIAEQVRRAVYEGDWPDRGITISVGIARLGRGELPKNLIRRADAALYYSKNTGRNRVSIGPDYYHSEETKLAG